MKVGKNTLR